MLISQMKPGVVYSFQTHSPVFLGSSIKRAKLIGIGDLSLAKTISPIEQMYAKIFPALPPGETYDASLQKYYFFEQENGDRIAMAGQWIVEGSIEEYAITRLKITINDANADANKASRALRAAGFTNITVSAE